MKHINLVRSTIRELNDMGKTINEQETVEWILMSLPDSGPDNYNTFMNHLKPTPDHKVTLKTLMGALLNKEEKRRERDRDRREDLALQTRPLQPTQGPQKPNTTDQKT
ncbi:hypothetical protein Ae201684P_010810 [Aphanomyces euteiches]|nr:hypothetical protein Ae201684P_010810 [Aphanomyces euteiches]